jgi:RND family efflux transporter MFP subunit
VRIRYLTLLVLGLALCSCSTKKDSQGAPAKKGGGGPPPARVQVAVARAGTLDSKLRFLGNVRSSLSTPIAAAVDGTAWKVEVREGQSVAEGALMVLLDPRRARADLKSAEALIQKTEAQLAQARRQAERIKSSGAALSEPERERYRLDVAVLEAELSSQKAAAQRVRVDLDHHRITAPFSGVVQARLVNPGAWVKAGDSVVELVSTEEIEVLVDVPFETGRAVHSGDAARFFSDTQSSPAVIAGVVPALDPNTRTMRLRVEPADEEATPDWLLPGLPVDVELSVAVTGDGLLVPRDAVIRGPVESRVIKVEGGTGAPIPVEILGASAEQVMVRGEGLAGGDQVMTRGNERYRPGTPVTVETSP